MEYSDLICYKWWLAVNLVFRLLMLCSYSFHTLTCVVPEVTSIRVGVKVQVGAELQPHSGEVLMVRQLPVAHCGRSGTQRTHIHTSVVIIIYSDTQWQ
jgi:hypothetical protein